MDIKCGFTTGQCQTPAAFVWQGRTLCPEHFPHRGDTAAAASAAAVFAHRFPQPPAKVDHLTAAVRDAVQATGIAPWDVNRRQAAVARTTRALTELFEQAALRGLADDVVGGYFKLSAREPHRLPKLVDSIVALRLPQVARSLVAYNAEH